MSVLDINKNIEDINESAEWRNEILKSIHSVVEVMETDFQWSGFKQYQYKLFQLCFQNTKEHKYFIKDICYPAKALNDPEMRKEYMVKHIIDICDNCTVEIIRSIF